MEQLNLQMKAEWKKMKETDVWRKSDEKKSHVPKREIWWEEGKSQDKET